MKNWTAEAWVKEYGVSAAYDEAVAMTAVAKIFGDNNGADMFANIAKELLQRGQHQVESTVGQG